MKRDVQIFGLLLLALAASGWVAVVAAAFCPHAKAGAETVELPAPVSEDHSCCRAKLEASSQADSQADCHDSAMKEEAAATGSKPVRLVFGAASGVEALGLPVDACAHCMGRPELPIIALIERQQVQTKRSFEIAALASTPPATFVIPFTPSVLYRQGAPPGARTPKHLLISVLLI